MLCAVPLGDYPGNDLPLLSDFLSFLQARVVRSSGAFDSSRWLVHLRNSTAKLVASMFELAVWNLLSNELGDEDKLQPHQLYSLKSGRKLRQGTLDKKHLIQKLADSHGGSHETILQTLSGFKGVNSVLMNVSNRIYQQAACASFAHCHTLSLSWDGACYAGHSVNISMALDCKTLNAAYMRPVVDTPLLLTIISLLKVTD